MAGPNTHTPLNMYVGYFHIQSLYVITTYMTYFYTDLFKKYFKLKLHLNVCLYERKRCKIYPTLVKANKII